MIDVKELKTFLEDNWDSDVTPYPKAITGDKIVNGSFEDGSTGWTNDYGFVQISTDQHRTGTHSLNNYSQTYYQVFSTPIPVSAVTELKFYAYNGNNRENGRFRVVYSDGTDSTLSINGSTSWTLNDALSILVAGKSISRIKFEGFTSDFVYIDDVSLIASEAGELSIIIDEYDPRDPNYQLLLVNRPTKNIFVAPNVFKVEQNMSIELHQKLVVYDPTDIADARVVFKAIKDEIQRIMSVYRYDTLGSLVNLGAWTDDKIPHGLGLGKAPLEMVSRMLIQSFEYKSTDGSLVGTRVSRVSILSQDLLGLIEVDWKERDQWVQVDIPRGPMVNQFLLSPNVDIVITSYDWASIHKCFYETAISTDHYPVLDNGTKLRFSTDGTEFLIYLVDSEGTTYTFNVYNVAVRTIDLVKGATSGQAETMWRITLQADLITQQADLPT